MRKISNIELPDESLIHRVEYKAHTQHCNPNITYAVDKTKCPRCMSDETALDLLKQGLKRYTFTPIEESDRFLPRTVWAVDENGTVYEARLERRDPPTYHGYPIQDNDAMNAEIKKKWDDRA